MIMFNPANDKYSDGTGTTEPKSHTLHQFGDLHLSNQCVQNPNNPEEVFLFATVRRLKPFYYYYCDKWAPWMAFNPEFDLLTKNNYKDKFGQLDNLQTKDNAAIDDQAFLITHNFVQPKQENARVSSIEAQFRKRISNFLFRDSVCLISIIFVITISLMKKIPFSTGRMIRGIR